MKKSQRKLCVAMGILVVICVIFSLIYINKEAHHDCSGEGCPVCLQIHAAQELLNNIKGAVLISLFCTVIDIFIGHRLAYGIRILRRQRSPVTLKVKLLN